MSIPSCPFASGVLPYSTIALYVVYTQYCCMSSMKGLESMPQKRTNLYLPELQLKKLHERSEREHLPLAELIRRAIDAYLAWDDPNYQPHPRPQTRNAFHPPH